MQRLLAKCSRVFSKSALAAARGLRGARAGQTVFQPFILAGFDEYLRSRVGGRRAELVGFRCPSVPGLVSIVLPVYNGERYLAEAIESILAQSYRQFELIVVDDGSTDSTPALLEDFAARDPRIRVLRQANQKIPAALSYGFSEARGKYLTWTSDDNRLRPEFLATMVAFLDARPEVDLVYSDYSIIDEAGRPLRDSDYCPPLQLTLGSDHIAVPREAATIHKVNGNYIGPAFMYRDRTRALVGDYSSAWYTCEDYDFFLRVGEQLTIRHLGRTESHYEYRVHGAQLSARKEELAILRRSDELLVFDDFRRELMPPIALPADGPRASSWPRLFHPCIQLDVMAKNGAIPEPPPDSSPCLRVLMAPEGTALPDEVPAGWDLCIALGDRKALPRLAGDRRGWYSAVDHKVFTLATLIRAKAKAARDVEGEIKNFAPSLDASFVICTIGASDRLREALRSALAQNYPRDRFEVILVENRSSWDPEFPGLTELVESLAKELKISPDCLVRIHAPEPGLSAARNAGISAARGRICFFMDDDAVAAPDLLSKIIADFSEHPDWGVVGGAIRLVGPEPRPGWFGEDFSKYWGDFRPAAGPARAVDDWREFPYGGNWAARRDLLLRVGGFRTHYGRVGSAGAGEEIVAALHIQKLGAHIAVDPAAVVEHRPDPLRFTIARLARIIDEGTATMFQMECDGLLPHRTTLRSLLIDGAKRLARSLAPGGGTSGRLENLFQARATSRLAWRYLKLQIRRFSPPWYE